MIIEFIAVPGSGKTFFSEKLYNYLKERISEKSLKLFNRNDINSIKRDKIFAKNKNIARLKIALAYIKTIDFNVLRFIIVLFVNPNYSFKVKSQLAMYLLDVFLNYRIIDDLKQKYNNKCVFILDEGLLHASSICMRECNVTNLENFFNKLKRKINYSDDELYIFIDCNKDIIYKRLSKRAEGWPPNWKSLTKAKKHQEINKSYLKFKAKKDFVLKNKKEKNYYLLDNSNYFDDYHLFFETVKQKIDL